MKRELRESVFRKKLDSARTTRKRLLEGASKDNVIYTRCRLKRLGRSLTNLRSSWILDGYTKDIISRFTEVLREDINDLSSSYI